MECKEFVRALFFVFLTTQVQPSPFVSQKLVEYLAEKSNPDVLPQESLKKPVKVKIYLSFINIREVDYKRGEVEIDAWMDFFWESGLTFSSSRFHNIDVVSMPTSKVWVPDIAVYNGQLNFLESTSKEHVLLGNSGRASWVPQTRIRFVCDVDEVQVLTNVTCGFKLGSVTYSGNQLELDNNTSVGMYYYVPNSRYELLDTSAERNTIYADSFPDPYYSLLFSFSFRKKTDKS